MEGLAVKKLLGLLGWLGVALVVAAVVIRFAKPEWQDWSQRLALAGLAVTAVYAASQWRDIGRSFGGRNVKYGTMAFGGVLMFIVLLVGANYLGVRHNKIWDLTSSQQFSLSDQTTKILQGLKQPLTIRVFFDSSDPSGNQKKALQDQLSLYEYASKQVSVQYIDAVKDPIQSKQFDIQSVPTTVFEYGGKTERATGGRTESDFTNALKKLLEGKTKKAYFASGHGEHDMEGTDQRGYAGAVSALKEDNFESAKIVIPQESKIPDDATLLVIAGPKTDYTTPEVDAIKAYLAHGGKLMLMLDPQEKADSTPLTNLIALAKDWGIAVGANIVLDVSGTGRQIGAGPTVPIGGAARPLHPIAERTGDIVAVFPLARSATPIDGGTSGKIAQKVIVTSSKSWGESNLKDLFDTKEPRKEPKVEADKGDIAGPVTIMSAVSAAVTDAPAGAAPDAPKAETRVVVAGDSDFVSNAALPAQGNRDWFLNAASWLAQQENLISIRAKDPGDRRLQLTADQSQRIFWLTIAVIPLMLVGNGFWVWWKRRK